MEFNADLLEKFIQGDCTPEQIAFIQSYLAQADKSTLEAIWAQDWEEVSGIADSKAKMEIWQRLQAHAIPPMSEDSDTKRLWIPQNLRMYAVAASIILLISIGVGLRIFSLSDPASPQFVLNDTGQPLAIALSDHSAVWLTPGSRLAYPEAFAANERVVTLEGQGFFEVTSDSTRPFLVKSGQVTTKVLGTSFDVRAIPDQAYVEVALLSGAVQIEKEQGGQHQVLTKIKPGELFRYHKAEDRYDRDTISSQAAYQWQEGIIQFEGAKVERVAETLEEWYDISVRIDSPLTVDEQLYYRIDTKRMPIEEVVAGINLVMTHYQYQRINDQTFTVKRKK